MNYPSIWGKEEHFDVFRSFKSNVDFYYPVEYDDHPTLLFSIKIKDLPIPIDNYTNSRISKLKQALNQNNIEYEIVNFDTNGITLLGNNAYKLTYIINGIDSAKVMEIWTAMENRLYHLRYIAEPTEYLSTFQQFKR